MLPSLVAHADWSIGRAKRWMAVAERAPAGRYVARAPERVDDAAGLVARLSARVPDDGAVLLGFDFPIGLPAAFAERGGIPDFRAFLQEVGTGEWRDFLRVAERAEEISHRRPFYPHRPGATKQVYLLQGLRLSSFDELRRQCERAQPGRRAASPLFWTLGGQQVGKAAISGWEEVVGPALRAGNKPAVALWPFDGALDELLKPGTVVIAETYPAEYYKRLGVFFPASRAGQRSGKRVQSDRQANAPQLLRWASDTGIVIADTLRAEIERGFGEAADGEDKFDAVVGLFGMLEVVLGMRPSGEPDDEKVRRVEGWILGQAAV